MPLKAMPISPGLVVKGMGIARKAMPKLRRPCVIIKVMLSTLKISGFGTKKGSLLAKPIKGMLKSTC
jgi:hypothetical protein